MLSKSQVLHISNLARIKLTPAEVEKFQEQLSSILDYVSKLNEVDSKNIEPISQITGLENITREDTIIKEQSLRQDAALANAPEKENGYFKTQPVF
ncbi:MAG: Asp-tRNA(Asn)/Glu-tRNA(Gln) amidotransferase subunit GatC [Candidatus Cloacimonetes bacterium]|nr:Asp-tRNA(Asn)/Glu-tRNA(Gln) amidotransferase subunit GatC [Candidatus Cloacimonadota bacterium]